jgi:hypothetical protein
MDNWQATFLGLKQLPPELTAFEIEAFLGSHRPNARSLKSAVGRSSSWGWRCKWGSCA